MILILNFTLELTKCFKHVILMPRTLISDPLFNFLTFSLKQRFLVNALKKKDETKQS